MNKRFIIFSVVALMLLFPIRVYADGGDLDEAYIQYFLDKASSMDPDKLEQMRKGMQISFSSRALIEGLERNWKKQLTDELVQELEKKGITDELVVSNLEKIKNWSYEDRGKFVDYVFERDINGIKGLSDKYNTSTNDTSSPLEGSSNSSSSSSSSGGSSSGGGSSSSAGQSVGTQDNTTSSLTYEIEKVIKNSRGEKWIKEGFIGAPIAELNVSGVERLTDLNNHWSRDYVDFLVKRGIVYGRTDDTFVPDAPIQKAEILTMISNIIIHDKNLIKMELPTISDVTESDWYAPYVNQMVGLGVSPLDDKARANPNQQLSRQESVKLLINALRVLGIEKVDISSDILYNYTDIGEINPENFDAMREAVALGFICGTADDKLSPNLGITRGQITVMLKNFYDYIITKAEEV